MPSLNLTQVQSLCDNIGGVYTQKSGANYLSALKNVLVLKNKNDNPFTREDIIKQPTLNQFTFVGKNDFKKICELEVLPLTIKNGKITNEKILAINFVDDDAKNVFNNSLGVAYILTCDKLYDKCNHIIKFGQTRTTFKKRLGSYNCGVVRNWRTASTTNIKILQSMVTTRLQFNLYLFVPDTKPIIITWHGKDSVPFASPWSLAVEDIMVKEYINQFGNKPLANVQADATTV